MNVGRRRIMVLEKVDRKGKIKVVRWVNRVLGYEFVNRDIIGLK